MVCLLIYVVCRDSKNVTRYLDAVKKEETVVEKDGICEGENIYKSGEGAKRNSRCGKKENRRAD